MKENKPQKPTDGCQHEGCLNTPLSYMNWCHEHLPGNESIERKMEGDKAKTNNSLFLEHVELANFTYRDKELFKAVFNTVEFENVIFENIQFTHGQLKNCRFSQCRFSNCRFDKTKIIDWQVDETVFDSCTFDEVEMASVCLNQNDTLINCDFGSCTIAGGGFYNSHSSNDVKFSLCFFIQHDFRRFDMNNYLFSSCGFDKTTFYDCRMTHGDWRKISHDFELLGIPMLCDFADGQFIGSGFEIGENFRRWNNFREPQAVFYLRVIEEVSKHPESPDNLEILNSALNRLDDLLPNADHQRLVNHIQYTYEVFVERAKRLNNFGLLGAIIGHYSQLPPQYKTAGLALPPVGGTQEHNDRPEASLQLRFSLAQNSPAQLQQFFNAFTDCTLLLPNQGEDLSFNQLRLGSIVLEIVGKIGNLLLMGLTLREKQLKLKIDQLNLQKLERENDPGRVQRDDDKAHLENEILLEDWKRKVLDNQEKERNIERQETLAQLEVEEKQLNLEAQELALWQSRVAAFHQLDALLGHPYQNHINSQRGLQMQEKAKALINQFPVEEATLNINRLQIEERGD